MDFADQGRHTRKSARAVARGLAMACLAGDADPLEIRRRCFIAVSEGSAWLTALTQDLVRLHGSLLRSRDLERLSDAILGNSHFQSAFEDPFWPPQTVRYYAIQPVMLDAPSALGPLDLPSLPTPGDLARWLGVSTDELEWLADPAGWHQRAAGPLAHYRYRWVAKRDGGRRLLEIPKSQLRRMQRQILREVICQVPTHDAAHGCVRHRSIFTNAAPHSHRASLLRIDLSGFFTSIKASRIHATFVTLGYPAATARVLAALTTNLTPFKVLLDPACNAPLMLLSSNRNDEAARYRTRHLPQGAPSSPGLANLAAWRLDLRLAEAADASEVRYTRYVDDMFFSSDALDRRRMRRFADMVYAIVLEEGFVPNFRKTRFMGNSTSQRAAGLTVNSFPNISRTSYDQLKAILTNCARDGPAQQNRSERSDFRAHLLGRISFIEQANASRGAKLRALMGRIDWNAPP